MQSFGEFLSSTAERYANARMMVEQAYGVRGASPEEIRSVLGEEKYLEMVKKYSEDTEVQKYYAQNNPYFPPV